MQRDHRPGGVGWSMAEIGSLVRKWIDDVPASSPDKPSPVISRGLNGKENKHFVMPSISLRKQLDHFAAAVLQEQALQ
ncbi:hypothetical protein KSP39_PZI022680 [Platanthera zijinensis]|uniref:Uncharacterized protein n=1 Tax=Platanthera zijinensis TaxID=2320716 RepID=A0AAP0FV01_9ASPA